MDAQIQTLTPMITQHYSHPWTHLPIPHLRVFLVSELVMGCTVRPGPGCLSEGHVFCEMPAWGGTGSLGIEVMLRVLGRWQGPG